MAGDTISAGCSLEAELVANLTKTTLQYISSDNTRTFPIEKNKKNSYFAVGDKLRATCRDSSKKF